MAASSRPPTHLLLTVHAGSGAAVWDMRAQQLVAVVVGSGDDGSGHLSPRVSGSVRGSAPVTSAVWLGGAEKDGSSGGGGSGGGGGSSGSSRGDFATGHSNGEILIWALPTDSNHHDQQQPEPPAGLKGKATAMAAAAAAAAAAAIGRGDKPQGPLPPRLVSRLRVVQSSTAQAVRALSYLVVDGRESLLALGGQEEDRPNGLTLLPIPQPPLDDASTPRAADGSAGRLKAAGSQDQGAADALADVPAAAAAAAAPSRAASGALPGAGAAARALPWFGIICAHTVVPASGAGSGADAVDAVLSLCEGGELLVYDLTQQAAAAAAGGRISSSGFVSGRGTPEQQGAAPAPARGYASRFQAQPKVTAVWLRVLPVEPVEVEGEQVRRRGPRRALRGGLVGLPRGWRL
jgi:hypothetical protein